MASYSGLDGRMPELAKERSRAGPPSKCRHDFHPWELPNVAPGGPGTERKLYQLCSSLLAPQLFLPPLPFVHRQRLQLIHDPREVSRRDSMLSGVITKVLAGLAV